MDSQIRMFLADSPTSLSFAGILRCGNWTLLCLMAHMDRSHFVILICRVNRSPFSPAGEKVADRPDEGAYLDGSVLNQPHQKVTLPLKKTGENWQHFDIQFGARG